MTELMTNYLAAWNQTDQNARAALLAEHWAPDVTYTDPLVSTRGVAELDAVIAAVHTQFLGFVFTAAGAADEHHNQARFTWNLGPGDGDAVIVGFDVITTDDKGRINAVLGFLDRVPS